MNKDYYTMMNRDNLVNLLFEYHARLIKLKRVFVRMKIKFGEESKTGLGVHSYIAYFATNVGIKKSLLSLFSVGCCTFVPYA